MAWASRLRELSGRLRDLSTKYGKVAVGVHFSVSALSTATFYVAIKNNVDVTGIMGALGVSKEAEAAKEQNSEVLQDTVEVWSDDDESSMAAREASSSTSKPSSGTQNKAAMGTGSALGIALLCNKALFPIRVPITLALTPPVARFIRRFKLGRSY